MRWFESDQQINIAFRSLFAPCIRTEDRNSFNVWLQQRNDFSLQLDETIGRIANPAPAR